MKQDIRLCDFFFHETHGRAEKRLKSCFKTVGKFAQSESSFSGAV